MSYLSPGEEQEDKRTGTPRRVQRLPASDLSLGASDGKALYLDAWYRAKYPTKVGSGLRKQHFQKVPFAAQPFLGRSGLTLQPSPSLEGGP